MLYIHVIKFKHITMETTNQGPNNTSIETVAPMWEVLNANMEVITPQQTTEQAPDINADNIEVPAEPAVAEPAKTEPAAEPAKTETAKTETAKTEDVDAGDLIEFTLEDVKDAVPAYEPNTALAIAQDLGLTLEKDSFDDLKQIVKEKFVNKDEFEAYKAKVDQEYIANTFSPEVAAAIHQVELGLPKELIFEPTKQIDELLTLDDVELVRKKYELNPNMTPDLIDIQLEEDIATGRIDAQAKILRINLNENRENILNERTQLIEKYTQEKQLAAVRQKEQEFNQVKEALSNVSDFLGVRVNKEAINGIITKLNKGAYDNELSAPMSKAQLILYKEFGERFAKLAQDKARAQGKAEITAKLSNVPIKTSPSGSRVDNKSDNKQDDHPFANMPVFA